MLNRKHRKLISVLFLLLLGLFCSICFLIWRLSDNEIQLSIKNISGKTVDSIIVKFMGGSVRFNLLKNNEIQTKPIKIATDSHLIVELYSVHTLERRCSIDTYLDDSTSGEIELLLNESDEIIYSDKLKLLGTELEPQRDILCKEL
jgi:hypothetical protein